MKFIILFILFLPLQAAARFVPPKPVVETLPSGGTVFFLEDHLLPTVEMKIFFRGSVTDPRGREGLAQLLFQTLRTGGSTTTGFREIEEELDFLGATLTTEVHEEFSAITLKILKKDYSRGLEILFSLLKFPAFEPSQFLLAKKQFIQEVIRQETESPLDYALREFRRSVYGGSLWGRHPTARSIRRIDREDLVETYRKKFGPDRLVIAVSGDLEPLALFRDLKIQLAGWSVADWPGDGWPGDGWPEVTDSPPRRGLLEKKGLTQSTILVGHLGEARSNPDKYALLVMNYILGGSGSLTSRLGEKIRTEGGKAYAVWSQFGFGEKRGLFYAATQTANDQTADVLKELEGEVRRIATDPKITREELTRAKKGILYSFVFEYETSFELVTDLAKFFLWGYPDDYLVRFQERVDALSIEEVEAAARKYVRPEQFTVFVLGDPSIRKGLGGMKKW